ncbi:MerR family transcriptional regulator [Streptomyces candidus]|uniref:DNA-binding transcriptional MerR regulator n=1 Tax=Streptomyces candidus TaxID=67283 RepID=A0A7X0HE23_9ACTN|nr:MerR family transcriptional regulator [Streptomyces candidus]MBB6435821.1 DNA-binding transcriptional MerR regulator [Streptomyces candidus]GHH42584.1 transcriptional regulator [Streptomyces candidus]
MSSSPVREPVGAAAAALSTGAVARRLGVAPTTLRTWHRRYGIGPAGKGGQHRRWEARDVEVLERMCRLTASGVPPAEAARAALAAPSGPPATGTAPGDDPADAPSTTPAPGRTRPAARSLSRPLAESRGLTRAAARLDAPAVDRLLTASIAERGLVAAWDDVIMPALHSVGRRWQTSGDRYVEVEHLLSWHVSRVLARSAPPPADRTPRPSSPPVLLACVPGEIHTLPLEALAAALAERDVAVSMFGASVPVPALEEAVRRTGPGTVVLWSQARSTASRPLAQHLGSITWGVRGARTGPAMMLAGPGWAGPHLAGALRPRGLREALDMLLPPGAPH